jgi:hypothetical protein
MYNQREDQRVKKASVFVKGPEIVLDPGLAFLEKRGKKKKDCDNCVISAINGQPFPRRANKVTITVAENVGQVQIQATPDPRGCPCEWSRAAVEYVVVLTGGAERLRRKDFNSPQLIDTARGIRPNNQYFMIAGCTLTVDVSAINRDFRRGINIGRALRTGVPLATYVRVRCNSRAREVRILITDP